VGKSLYAALKALSKEFKRPTGERSSIFRKIRSGRNRSTEWRLRGAFIQVGLRGWRVRPKEIPGKPDFFFEQQKLAVFVDGCYWHGCKRCGHIPKANSSFWRRKFALTQKRDRKVSRELRRLGYRVIRVWEHRLAEGRKECLARIHELLRSRKQP
jgi:DNA mismatch endonuclease (patch repair protein)